MIQRYISFSHDIVLYHAASKARESWQLWNNIGGINHRVFCENISYAWVGNNETGSAIWRSLFFEDQFFAIWRTNKNEPSDFDNWMTAHQSRKQESYYLCPNASFFNGRPPQITDTMVLTPSFDGLVLYFFFTERVATLWTNKKWPGFWR